MLCVSDEKPPRSRVKGRLRPYAAWRSAPLTLWRGYTLVHGSKCGIFALTAMQTGVFSARFTRIYAAANSTLTQTSVYPREVVKRALFHNAAAVIFAHNHPSGDTDPSRSDEMLTTTLKTALALVDVRVLDHFVVAGNKALSFAERGLL
jgi:proteasome lid subunit RPN8/RPN11